MVAVSTKPSPASSAARVHAATIVPAKLTAHRVGRSDEVLDAKKIVGTIRCASADVATLSVSGTIVDATVADDSIGRVVSSTSRHLRLAGIHAGRTMVAVRMREPETGNIIHEAYEWLVDSPANERADESNHDHALMQLIQQKYSTASVQVSRRSDRIIVRGACDDVEEAKEIVRLIRKTYLVPVEDQLILR